MTDKITITVDGYDASQVGSWLDEKIGKALAGKLEEKIEDAVEARVSKLVEEITRERVSKEIDAVLAKGWTETDRYGNPTGKVYSVRDRVHDFFNKPADSYRGSYVEEWLKSSTQNELHKYATEEVKLAKEKLRKMFDEAIVGKFSATIREALGVK